MYDVNGGVFWNRLSLEDQRDYTKLKEYFLRSANLSGKDRRTVTFSKELASILRFIEKDSVKRELRSIIAGVCFAGPFICVNTRQLKSFLGRCKSSINGSFQQIGYVAIRTKMKSRNCVLSLLSSLNSDPSSLRQWTVRYASSSAEVCFLSPYPVSSLPTISDEDLFDDKPTIPHSTSLIINPPPIRIPSFPVSKSQNKLTDYESIWEIRYFHDDIISEQPMIPRSLSASLDCITDLKADCQTSNRFVINTI